ncbi:MAG: heavy-metal-associated domain-containing protein [Acidobacteriota bacterium]
MRTITLTISGMSCDACVRHVTRVIQGLPGVRRVAVDLRERRATVECQSGAADGAALIAAVRNAGYDAHVDAPRAASVPAPTGGPAAGRGCGCCVVPPEGD